MKVVTPEGYTFVTKFQEDNSHKVLRSVDFFQSNSMKSSSTLFAGYRVDITSSHPYFLSSTKYSTCGTYPGNIGLPLRFRSSDNFRKFSRSAESRQNS